MDDIRLRPMTAAEFGAFRARCVRDYAAAHVRAGDWDPDAAEESAAREMDGMLPGGVATPGVLLLVAENAGAGAVGAAWVALDRVTAWLVEIDIHPEHRGKGYGRALLAAVERESARRGATALGLNVFGPNAAARRLYETSGYQITALQMRKELADR
jgi:GNAT superfamily N-acetyltransferase